MQPAYHLTWPRTISEARQLQIRDRTHLRIRRLRKIPEWVAGADAAFSEESVFSAACLYRYPELDLIETATAVRKATFPYVPGFLFFREGPAIMTAVKKLKQRPDIILIDGQGLAHPAGIGSASHLGLLLGIPTIGCAKTKLVGDYREPGLKRGCSSGLALNGRIVGSVIRTRDHVRPLFVSPGFMADLADAIAITLGTTRGCRLPEPLRCADRLSRKLKRDAERTAGGCFRENACSFPDKDKGQ